MVQNRNKLIELFIGNVSNMAVHEILGKAIDDESIRDHYSKELKVIANDTNFYTINRSFAYYEKTKFV